MCLLTMKLKLRVAKRQCFSNTKERTYWQVTRIGLSGYAAAMKKAMVGLGSVDP